MQAVKLEIHNRQNIQYRCKFTGRVSRLDSKLRESQIIIAHHVSLPTKIMLSENIEYSGCIIQQTPIVFKYCVY